MGSPSLSVSHGKIFQRIKTEKGFPFAKAVSAEMKRSSPEQFQHFQIAPGRVEITWDHERNLVIAYMEDRLQGMQPHGKLGEHGALRWNVAAEEVVESSVLQPVCHFVHCLLVFEEIYGGFMVALFAGDFRYFEWGFCLAGFIYMTFDPECLD